MRIFKLFCVLDNSYVLTAASNSKYWEDLRQILWNFDGFDIGENSSLCPMAAPIEQMEEGVEQEKAVRRDESVN